MKIEIGNRFIGYEEPCFIIAEAGSSAREFLGKYRGNYEVLQTFSRQPTVYLIKK